MVYWRGDGFYSRRFRRGSTPFVPSRSTLTSLISTGFICRAQPVKVWPQRHLVRLSSTNIHKDRAPSLVTLNSNQHSSA